MRGIDREWSERRSDVWLQWGRWSEYKIVAGALVPAPGATFDEYDPWELYTLDPKQKAEEPNPYLELIQLADRADDVPRAGETATSMEQAVLRWCARYGLLGLLPHRASHVYLAPRWSGRYEPPRQDNAVLAAQFSYHRAWRWESFARVAEDQVGDASRQGEVIDEGEVAACFPKPGVMIRGLIAPDYKFESLSSSWAQFFPAVPAEEAETFPYPLPLTMDFWALYGEPVADMLAAAAALRAVFDEFSSGVDLKSVLRERPEQVAVAVQGLQHVIAPACPMPVISADGFVQERLSTPSLLCSLGLMMLQDLASFRRLFRCQVCGRPAVAGSNKTRNCSERCRDLGKKRRKAQSLSSKPTRDA